MRISDVCFRLNMFLDCVILIEFCFLIKEIGVDLILLFVNCVWPEKCIRFLITVISFKKWEMRFNNAVQLIFVSKVLWHKSNS